MSHPEKEPSRENPERRTWRNFLDHPENDLTADADFHNRRPPEPQTAEDLASSTDPVVQQERNRRSNRQALTWMVCTIVLTIGGGLLLALVTRLLGGPLCEAGEARWLCTRSAQIWWPIVTSIFAMGGVIGCAIIMVRKLNSFTRWRPWMGVFWVLIPFAMMWMVQTWQILIAALNS